jgi:hypothetical protein
LGDASKLADARCSIDHRADDMPVAIIRVVGQSSYVEVTKFRDPRAHSGSVD